MTWYSLLKFVHVLLAITAVGSNITYAAWNIRGAREPQHLSFTLKGIQFLDNRVANPAYGLLLLTGLILVAVGNWGARGWIAAALILFVVLIVIAVGFYSRVTTRQIQALEAGGRGLAGLPAAGWAGADLWDRQHRDRACDRLPHGRQALPLRPFPSPACGGDYGPFPSPACGGG